MSTRREFLGAALAVGTVTMLPFSLPLRAASRKHRYLSAVDNAQGRHFLRVSADAVAGIDLPTARRGHGSCQRPGRAEAVIFDRRPGRQFHVIGLDVPQVTATIDAEADHHFFGHGTFSPDGRFLYATANHIPTGQGVICVYDASRGYRFTTAFPVGGMDPHEIRLMPDGESLVIALGGIHTDPNYERIKLNLDTMQPAVVLMDRHTGTILQRHTPSNHQLSAHHLDVAPDGTVVVGYQYEGPDWEAPPLIGVLNSHAGRYDEVAFDDLNLRQLRNYIASVAVNPRTGLAAVTAPRGNLVALFDYRTHELERLVSVADVAGVVAEDLGFVVSSGHGGLYRVDRDRDQATLLGSLDQRWDNHLTRLRHA